MAEVTSYHRLLLDLRPGGLDRATLRAAAGLARLLDVEMLGIFVEDQSVVGAANLPFARELQLPARDWRPVNADRLAAELQVAAEQARLLLLREGKAAGIRCRFVVRRGDPATTIASLCSFHDIVAVAEPEEAIERLTGTAGRVRDAALSSEATVLLLPSRPSRSAGPVIVLIAAIDDPALAVAARLAATSREPLVIVFASDVAPAPAAMRDATRAAGLSAGRVEVVALGGHTVASLLHALDGRQGRLVVMSRNRIALPDGAPARLAEGLRGPVLGNEPPQPAPRPDPPAGG